jgi:PleD family two-component response regulator
MTNTIDVIYIGDQGYSTCIRSELKKAGIIAQIKTVTNGTHIYRWLQSNPVPDVIFVDIDFSISESLILLQLLRNKICFSDIPIIVLSKDSYIEQITTTFEAGANLFLSKTILTLCGEQIIKNIFCDNWKDKIRLRNKYTYVINHIIHSQNKKGYHAL